MILITVGSQIYPFDRLLAEVDDLIQKKVIQESVFAQIGHTQYKPKYFAYEKFLDREDLLQKIYSSRIVITHAGTGAIMNAVKLSKKTIVVPRRAAYGEHVNDHQLEITTQFANMNLIEPAWEVREVGRAIQAIEKKQYAAYISGTASIIEAIDNFIENTQQKASFL